MAAEAQIPALGFLTVVEDAEHGLFGGYLVLNLIGRPLEFHCTAPVKPNRAQQILYGPTLAPYLYGEQIAATLIRKATVKTSVVFTDLPAVLAARELVDMPVVATHDSTAAATTGAQYRLDGPEPQPGRWHAFHWANQPLRVAGPHQADEAQVLKSLAEVADDFDLAEPFQRIREAIAEASRS